MNAQHAVIVEEQFELGLDELGRACRCSRETLVTLVHEGVLAPANPDSADWRFDAEAFKRARRAARLMQELELNLPGVAVALDLLERIDELNRRMAALERGHR